MKKRSLSINYKKEASGELSIIKKGNQDFISLTDMSKSFVGDGSLIESWMRNRNTVEFLGIWEKMHNPNFNSVEFDGIFAQTGLNRFKLSAKKWIGSTNAIGIEAKAGRYGGTYAHKDIAINFGYYLSPNFQIYLIKEFQNLQEERKTELEWSVRRLLSKINYRIHSEAVKTHLIPHRLPQKKKGIVYASEADLLNLSVFGMTAKEWKMNYPEARGNMRDHASLEQLTVLANLESINAEMIKLGTSQDDRLDKLSEIAVYQIQVLVGYDGLKKKSDPDQLEFE